MIEDSGSRLKFTKEFFFFSKLDLIKMERAHLKNTHLVSFSQQRQGKPEKLEQLASQEGGVGKRGTGILPQPH